MANEPVAFRLHPMWRSAAIFAFGAGIVILATWVWHWLSGDLAADMTVEPWAAWTRLVAEIATALALIFAGYALFTNARRARQFYLIATGMLLFAGLTSLGQYMHKGQPGIVILYLVIAVFAITFAMRVEE